MIHDLIHFGYILIRIYFLITDMIQWFMFVTFFINSYENNKNPRELKF